MTRPLKPESARNILTIGIYLSIMAAIGALLDVLELIYRSFKGNGTGLLTLPYQLKVQLGDTLQLHTAVVGQVATLPLGAALLLGLVGLGLGVAGGVLLSRASEFVNRLTDDPFHPFNARDLSAASRLALWVQGVVGLAWIALMVFQPASRVAAQVQQALGNTNAEVKVEGLFSSFSYSLLLPLLLWAIFATLAAVFQRGHDLREEERRLRQEQELTI